MLSVKTPSFAECIGRVRYELTRGFLLKFWSWRNSFLKQHGQTVTPFSGIPENLETLFLLCTSSVACYTVTALHFRSQLCLCPRAQTCVVDPLDRAMLRHCTVSKESTCLGLHMRLEIQLAFETYCCNLYTRKWINSKEKRVSDYHTHWSKPCRTELQRKWNLCHP